MYYNCEYKIDWTKIQTQEDIILVLKALDISFEPNSPSVEILEGYLYVEPKGNPIQITD